MVSGLISGVANFQTIESILKPEVPGDDTFMTALHFQTIESILKRMASYRIDLILNGFPDY